MLSVTHGDVVLFEGNRVVVVATDEDGGVKIRHGNGLVLDCRLNDLEPAPAKAP